MKRRGSIGSVRGAWLAALALGLICVASAAWAGPIGYSVRSNADDHLYSIDLATGAATDLGLVNFGDAEGLEFVGSTLYAIGGSTMEFWNITTPPGIKVGDTGTRSGLDAGLGYDLISGKLFNVQGGSSASSLYQINTSSGAATLVGSNSTYLDSLAVTPSGVAYAADWGYTDSLYTLNLTTAATTLVGSLGLGDVSMQSGLAYDAASSSLYAITSGGGIYRLNTSTGAATFVANVTLGGQAISDFEGLAIQGGVIPEPVTVLLLGAGLGVLLRRRRR